VNVFSLEGMEPLKEMYSKEWAQYFGTVISKVDPKISEDQFSKKLFNSNWKQLELKERISSIANVLLQFWGNEPDQLGQNTLKIISILREEGVSNFNFLYIFLNELFSEPTHFDFNFVMEHLEQVTVFSSSEFVIRQYYLSDFDKTFQQMKRWANHPNDLVRRLASEGSRPFLPWGIGIPKIKSNPGLHLPILEKLWDDQSETVRRSVANHLNDISKINPEIVLSFCKSRMGKNPKLDVSLKHSLRTLLKKGNPKALAMFDYKSNWKPKTIKLEIKNKNVIVGKSLEFEVEINSSQKEVLKIRLEYKIGFLLANGNVSKKVFQLGEKSISKNSSIKLSKKHSFKPITTKTYYPGKHSLVIVANGKEWISKEFILRVK